MRRARFRRVSIWITGTLGVILAVVLSVYFLRDHLLAPHLKNLLQDSIESNLGIRLSIGGIHGSYLTNLALTDVAGEAGPEGGAIKRLKVTRFRVDYLPGSLWKGIRAFVENATVTMDGAELEVDLSDQGGGLSAPEGDARREMLLMPEVLPRMRVRGMSAVIRGRGFETRWSGVEVEVRRVDPMIYAIGVEIDEWRWRYPGLRDGKARVSADITYGKGEVIVGPLRVDRKVIAEAVRIGLGDLPRRVSFDARLFPAGGTLVLAGDLERSVLHARIDARELDVAQLFSLLSSDGPGVAGKISMTGGVSLPWLRPVDAEADLDLSLTNGHILGLKTDRLELLAGARAGIITVDRLRLVSGQDVVDARAVTFPAETAFAGDLRGLFRAAKGEFAIECRDLPALLRLMGQPLPAEGVTVPEHRVRLQGSVREGEVEVSGGSLTVDGGGHIRVGPSRIAWPAHLPSILDASIETAMEVDISDLGLIRRIAPVPPLKGFLRGAMNIKGPLGAPSGNATFTGGGLGIAGIWLGDIELRAEADTRGAAVRSLVLRRGGDRLSGSGRFRFAERRVEDVRIEFQLSDIAPYIDMLLPGSGRFLGGKASVHGGATGDLSLSGPLRMPDGAASLRLRRVHVAGNPWGDAALRVRSEGGTISVEECSVRNGGDRIVLSGVLNTSAMRATHVNLEIAVEELARYAKGLLPDAGSIGGGVRAVVKASGTLEEPEGRMEISLGDLHAPGLKLDKAALTCRSSGRVITIDSAEVRAAQGKGTLSGKLFRGAGDKEFDLDLSDLVLTVHETRLALDRPARVSLLREGWVLSLRDVSLSGPPGRIRLDGRVDPAGESDLLISVSDLASGRWLASLATDRLSFQGLTANARLSGTRNSPRLDLRGDLGELSARGSPGGLSGSFDLSWGNGGLIVREFEWRGARGRRLSVAGTLPVDSLMPPAPLPGPLAMEAILEFPDLNGWDAVLPGFIPAGGSLFGRLQLGGTWDEPTGSITIRGRGLERPSRLPFLPSGPFDVQGLVRIKGRDASLESLEVRAPDLTFTGSGVWTGMPPPTTLFHSLPRKAPGRLALAGHLHSADLGWLAAQSPHIRRVSGQLDATLSLDGPAFDPTVSGTLRVTGGELRPEADLPSVQALHLDADATPDGVHVRTLSGELGAAPFRVTGSLGRTGRAEMEASLGLQGENLLLYRGEGVKLRADSTLTLAGPLSLLRLSGEVAVTDGYYEKYFDVLSVLRGSRTPSTVGGFQLFSLRTPPLSQAAFDVRFTSRQPFRVRNNLMKGSLRPDLRLEGTGLVPVLTGVVYVDETHLVLPAGTVRFESGLIRFDRTRPDRPILHLVGKSRIGGYDITMLVEGPLDEPTVTLSSVPPVSSEDLLRLVLTGRIPGSRDGDAVSSGAPVSIEDVHSVSSGRGSSSGAPGPDRQKLNVAVYVGRDLVARWFGGQYLDANSSILERFEIELGRSVTRSGDDTIDAQFRLAQGVLRDGDTLYITGEKDVFDFYNAGIKIVFRFK